MKKVEELLFGDSPEDWEDCHSCSGLGEVPDKDGKYQKCLVCRGTGLVRKEK